MGVGCAGFSGIKEVDGIGLQAEFGYWYGRPHWGQGIATEAARAVLSHGFSDLNVAVATSAFFTENPASARVLQKMGFVVTREGMGQCVARGTTLPEVKLELTKEQWLQQQAQ